MSIAHQLKKLSSVKELQDIATKFDRFTEQLVKIDRLPNEKADDEGLRKSLEESLQQYSTFAHLSQEPLEPKVLQSISEFHKQLSEHMQSNPEIARGIDGNRLCEMVADIKCDGIVGPFNHENGTFANAIDRFINAALSHIYEDKSEAAVCFSNHHEVEKKLQKRMCNSSNVLSSSDFLRGRATEEAKRIESALEFLSHLVSKVSVSTKRGGRIQQILSEKLQHIHTWEQEQQQLYAFKETEAKVHQATIHTLMNHLDEHEKEQKLEIDKEMRELEKEREQDVKRLSESKAQLEQILDTITDVAQKIQERDLKMSEANQKQDYTSLACHHVRAKLSDELDVGKRLEERWGRGERLQSKFSGFLNQAFRGMKSMDQSNAENLRDGAIADYCSFTALLQTIDKDINEQLEKLSGALNSTFQHAKHMEQELDSMQFRFVSDENMEKSKESFEQVKQSMQQQEQHYERLIALRERVSKMQETDYWCMIRPLVPAGPLVPDGQASFEEEKDKARQWVKSFFYTHHRIGLQKPVALKRLESGVAGRFHSMIDTSPCLAIDCVEHVSSSTEATESVAPSDNESIVVEEIRGQVETSPPASDQNRVQFNGI